MIFNRLAATALSASLLVTLAGCEKAVAPTGFIPGTATMRADGDLTRKFAAKGLDASKFGKVVVLPVEMPRPGAYGDLNEQQLENCRSIMQSELQKAFAKAPGTGDRTLFVHAAITEIKPNKPLLNVAPQTQLLKRGYGYAACEMFATDGQNGPVVAAFMQTADTARIGTEKLSATGTAEHAAGEWAGAFRAMFGN
jgi:hypothetical protein